MLKNNNLDKYKLTKKELIMKWLNNYEFDESLLDITEWAKFQSIDEFASRLVMTNEHLEDELFRFKLNLDSNEENTLCDYLLKRKSFVVNYILKRGSFSPNTHLYQLYLQYIPNKLNEVEKNILLEGYLHILIDMQGENYLEAKRPSLEKMLNLK